jgi:iron complex transport system substrate-binding protein
MRPPVMVARPAVVLMLLGVVGCARGPEPRPAARAGAPGRIVSLSPSATEILHGVGVFDRVVAVSQYCTYPPEVARLPRVGNWLSANAEQLATLRPDLIVMTEAQANFLEAKLQALGFERLVVRSQTLADAYDAIGAIGRAVGKEAEGKELAERTRGEVEAVRARTAPLAHPRVLCVVDRVPGTLRELYTATQGSFITELIEVAGGVSVAPKANTGYGKITNEALVALDPEIIIDMVQGSKGRLGEDPSRVWGELAQVNAVRNRRVLPLDDAAFLHPSQLVAESARRFAQMIHPEAFPRGVER